MVQSDSNNDNNFSEAELNNLEVVEVPENLNPFIKKIQQWINSLTDRLEKIELSFDNNITNTQENNSILEENIRKELKQQIEFIIDKIQKTESNFEKQNSELDYLKRELINILNKLDTRIEQLLSTFRGEVDRINSYQKSMEQLNEFKFKEISNGIDKISKNIPTTQEIYKTLTNEQSNLATKEQISNLNIQILQQTSDISREIAELKGKQSSNFSAVMGSIFFSLVTLFGTIISVSYILSNNIFKQVQPQVSQPRQSIPTTLQKTP